MKSSKPLREPYWIRFLDFFFDNAKGHCLGDLCEEYEEVNKRDGKLKAITWLCKQIVVSRSYWSSYSNLFGWCRDLRSKIMGAIKSLLLEKGKVILRPQILRVAAVGSLLLIALSPIFFKSYPHRQRTLDLATLQNELPRADLTGPHMDVVLTPVTSLRSDSGPLLRIQVDSTISIVRFHLEVPMHDPKPAYAVTLSTISENVTLGDVKRVGNKVSIHLPSRFIQTGDYKLTVSAGSDRPGYNYFFRVMSPASEN